MLLEEGVCYDQWILLANAISLCLVSFCTPRQNLPVTPGVSWLPTFAFQSHIMKRTSFLGHFQFALIHRPNTSGSYAIMFIIVSDFTSIASHIHKLVGFFFFSFFFCYLLTFFFFFGQAASYFWSMLASYQPGEFVFQCHIFLPFYTVHGVLNARIWSGFPFPSSVGHILS